MAGGALGDGDPDPLGLEEGGGQSGLGARVDRRRTEGRGRGVASSIRRPRGGTATRPSASAARGRGEGGGGEVEVREGPGDGLPRRGPAAMVAVGVRSRGRGLEAPAADESLGERWRTARRARGAPRRGERRLEAARGGGCHELAAAATAAGTLRSGGRGEGRRRGLARWTRKVETDVMAVVWRFGERRSG